MNKEYRTNFVGIVDCTSRGPVQHHGVRDPKGDLICAKRVFGKACGQRNRRVFASPGNCA